MTECTEVLKVFRDKRSEGSPYLVDLTLWYDWHANRGTLPERWHGEPLRQISGRLRSPAWRPVRPWSMEWSGIKVETSEEGAERVVTYETSSKRLVSRWILGPDGDWWQSEYPIKVKDQLDAAIELVEARTYTIAPTWLEAPDLELAKDAILVLELPKRPYSELVHDFLGWSTGLHLLHEPGVVTMLRLLESKLQGLVEEVAKLGGTVVLSPDNLDAQFISPAAFETYLAGSYQLTSEILHAADKRLVAHVGGPVRRLLQRLAATGLDGLQGICGPPQSDASLLEARELVGPGVALWGGIPQDVLMDAYAWDQFETCVVGAASDASAAGGAIVGIADRVPVNALTDRLKAVPSLIAATSAALEGST